MKLYISLFLILILSFSVFSQRKKASVKPATEPDSGFLTLPFDSRRESLPGFFLGHNPSRLLSVLFPFALEITKGCGKFETTEVCQKRLNGMYDRQLWKGLSASDLLAFSISVDCAYNANKAKAECESFGDSFNWSHNQTAEETYIGQNIFGAKTAVDYKKFENVVIKTDKRNIKFTLENLQPDSARIIVPHLHFLIVGEPLQPFAKGESISNKPTFDDPEHTEIRTYSLIIELKEIWLYDVTTGKVYEKQKFNL